jgi:hypothetical protein
MPKIKLREAYRHEGQVYGPSYTEAIEVPDEVAKAAGYSADIPVTEPELKGTEADQGEESNASAPDLPRKSGK